MTSAICNIASNQGGREKRKEAEKVELSEINDREREGDREEREFQRNVKPLS